MSREGTLDIMMQSSVSNIDHILEDAYHTFNNLEEAREIFKLYMKYKHNLGPIVQGKNDEDIVRLIEGHNKNVQDRLQSVKDIIDKKQREAVCH